MPKVKLPREAFRRVLERANVNSETRTHIKKLIEMSGFLLDYLCKDNREGVRCAKALKEQLPNSA